ncbi:hypothetical protein, partial [Pseudomonas viridiflava]|uniref:hypothetical protein n=1 Tax=Pseudomonas viridiflava TaxID=33069 RepID=UPI0019810AA7
QAYCVVIYFIGENRMVTRQVLDVSAAVSGIHTLLDEFLMRMARVVEYAYAMSTPESMARWVSFHRQRLK